MNHHHDASEDDIKDIKEVIACGKDTILRRWLSAVQEDFAVPSTDAVEKPILIDSVPHVLAEILRVVESDDEDEIASGHIGFAAEHGRQRARHQFSAQELVREYQILRQQIFLYLQEQHDTFVGSDANAMLKICTRVGAAIDKATRETIDAFVEEHTVQLRHLSRTDSLTKLFNHRTFYERLGEELIRARRYDSELAIAFIDLDNFKTVNDTRGHRFGDFLLTRCAETLRHELRASDIVCRYGGDEFGVLLPNTDGAEADRLMMRVRSKFVELGILENAPGAFGMSFGIAAFPADDGSAETLVQIADDRLLSRKERHRSVKIGR